VFTHPLFLIGLVAVGIPIAIHLLQLRRYKKVYFSNVDMLEELQNEDRRQRNLRQLLILAMRIFAIVFLVLAFAQPVIRSKGSQQHSGGTVVSVYIDNSYSMESGGMDGSLLESARRKAREISAAYKPGDQFQLLTNDLGGGQFQWLSREEFLTAVDGLQASAVTQSLSAVAQRQNEFLRSATSDNRHAYVISDFQRSTADIAEYPADSSILTTFIPLGGSAVANVYLDTLVFDSPAYYAGATVQVEVTVRNDGDKAVESLPLRLLVGDKQRAIASVDVAAHGSATAKMTFAIGDEQTYPATSWHPSQEGTVQGMVETTDYPITFDDRLYFSLPVVRQVPVMVVGGKGENPFLQRLFSGDSLVRYRQVSANQIDYAQFANGGFIVLDEMHDIPSGMAQTLHQFVEDGGSLLVIPGEGMVTESYNRLLAMMQAPQLGEWTTRKTRAEQVATDMPLFRGVFQGKLDDMELPSVIGHYRLNVQAGTVSQSVIKLLDGGDYLTCTPVGEGRCYLFAAPLRTEYTDFVQQALFVPTLYNMALFSTPTAVPYHLLTGNEPIALLGNYDAEDLPHLIGNEDESSDLIPDIRRIGSRQWLLTHGAVSRAGNYRLQATGASAPTEGLSFNYSRQESVMDFYTPTEVKQLVDDMHLDNCSVATSAQKSMTDYIRQRGQGKPLWRLFLLLALAALLAETILIKLKIKN
jgi:hypothetical protein